jgi:hypothetical protein
MPGVNTGTAPSPQQPEPGQRPLAVPRHRIGQHRQPLPAARLPGSGHLAGGHLLRGRFPGAGPLPGTGAR